LPSSREKPFPRVALHREIQCQHCGAPTPGSATCELCFEAIGELRGLAADFGVPTRAPLIHAVVGRTLSRQGTSLRRS
jgi:hypothetical protein